MPDKCEGKYCAECSNTIEVWNCPGCVDLRQRLEEATQIGLNGQKKIWELSERLRKADATLVIVKNAIGGIDLNKINLGDSCDISEALQEIDIYFKRKE